MEMMACFGAGIAFLPVLVACGYYLTRFINERIRRRDKTDELQAFLKRFGWQSVSQESESLVSRLKPMVGTVYEQYDWYWQKRFVQEFPKPEQVLMARFDKNGQCDVVEGTRWDVAIYQLNELLKLEAQSPVSKPPRPVIIKRGAGLPLDFS